jgi:RHS repeat-associated protein
VTGKRHGIATRVIALALCAELGPLACVPAPLVAPAGGVVEYRSLALVPVPGGFVDAAGGNLMLRGVGIALDTPLGTQRVGAIWNSAGGGWQWSHLVRYDGQTLVDASGAVIPAQVADGSPIPGTGWTRVDARRLRTRGGLLLSFRGDASLESLRFATLDYPRIAYAAAAISQCASASSCAPIFQLENHASGQPARVTDARSGRSASFSYDGNGRLVAARSPEDIASQRAGVLYQYAGSQLVATTSSEGVRVEYVYQGGGRIRSVTQRGEGDPSHVFDFYGRNAWGEHRTSHRNPLGGHTDVYFDDARRVLRIERFETGEAVTFAWTGLRPTRIVDAGGATTWLAWQEERVVARVTPSGNVVQVQYAAGALSPDAPEQDAILRVDDSLGPVEARSYDAAGRPVAIRNGAGEVRTLAWSGASLVRSAAGGVDTVFPVFGAHGHWLDALAGGSVLARRAFDVVGNEIVPPDALRTGGLLGLGFDADRHEVSRAVAASDDAGHVVAAGEIRVSRASDGGVRAIDRPGDGDHGFERDALGRVVRIRERAHGAWRDTRISYDAAGNPTSRELANGMREEWEYDVFGRCVRHLALRNGVLEGEETFTWQDGRLVAHTDSLRGGEVVVHDAAGRTAAVIFGYGESISYSYDARDRVTRELYSLPGVGTVADIGYAYDGANRRTGVQDRTSGDWLVRTAYADGRAISIDTGNGLRRTLGYDELGVLVALETRDAAGALVEVSEVSRAVASAPPRFEVRTRTTTALAATEERYWLPQGSSLASPDQRVGKRLFGWSRGAGAARRYAWDELGNRVDTSTGDHFGYDAERTRLLSASLPSEGVTIAYAYDAAGFVTSRAGVPLTWTALGRLASFGADTIQWDMAGRPIRIREAGVTREFRFFGGRVESSATALGALDLGDVVLALGSGARRYRHFDFREQVSFVSDDAGDVVAHFRYQPFGVDAGFGPESGARRFENRMGFGALYLLGARPLDPVVGRFLAPDPVLQLGSQYDYAAGNPVMFRDADGRVLEPRAAAESVARFTGGVSAGALSIAAILTGMGLAPGAFLVIGGAYGLASILIYAGIVMATADDEPTPTDGRITIEDVGPTAPVGPGGVGGPPATGIGCAPLALTRAGDGAGPRLLLFLLVSNALAVAVWWHREGRNRRWRCAMPDAS